MNRLISRCLVATLLVAGYAGTASARPISAVEGLEALRRGFAGITDFSAEITQEKRLKLMKRSLTMTGTVRFRKPDLFYMELNPPYASRMVLRDAVIEQVGTRDGERTRIPLPPEQGLRQWFNRLAAPVTKQPEGVDIQADLTGGVYTLGIIPRGKSQLKELSIVFLEDGTIRRLVIVEQNGDRAIMTFRKVHRNGGLVEKDFRLD